MRRVEIKLYYTELFSLKFIFFGKKKKNSRGIMTRGGHMVMCPNSTWP